MVDGLARSGAAAYVEKLAAIHHAVDDEYRLETLWENEIADIDVSRVTLDAADRAMSDLDALAQRIEDRRAAARNAHMLSRIWRSTRSS